AGASGARGARPPLAAPGSRSRRPRSPAAGEGPPPPSPRRGRGLPDLSLFSEGRPRRPVDRAWPEAADGGPMGRGRVTLVAGEPITRIHAVVLDHGSVPR